MSSSKELTKEGRWDLLHPGVKAPGTVKMITFLPARREFSCGQQKRFEEWSDDGVSIKYKVRIKRK